LWRVGRSRSVLWAALAAVAIAACFLLLPSDQLITRFAELSSPTELTNDGRLQLWRESIGLYRAFPIFGCGVGTFETAFLRYKAVAPAATADYAHNDYLQFLIELGAVGFVIGAVLFIAVIRRTAAALSHRYDPDTRLLAAGCLASLAAIGLHSLVDFNLHVPANATALAWIAALGASLQQAVRAPVAKPAAGLPQIIDITTEPPAR
jgi:O-antigen ligase